MDFTKPVTGHDCPNQAELIENSDDECDLPEAFRRFSYVLNVDTQHNCYVGTFSHMPRFCRQAIWREMKYEMRKNGIFNG